MKIPDVVIAYVADKKIRSDLDNGIKINYG